VGDADSYIRDTPSIAQIMGVDADAAGSVLTDAFNSMIVLYLGLLAVFFTVSALGRMPASEAAGFTEQMLATPVSRVRLLGSWVLVAVVGGVGVLACGGLGLGAAAATTGGSGGSASAAASLAGAVFAYVPAVLATAGLAAAVYGAFPRAAAVNWVVLAYSLVAAMFGGILKLPAWAVDLGPLAAIGSVVGKAWDPAPALALTAAALALAAVGWVALRRRDIPAV
jgi:ABC-2 type transport system permease protein